MGAVNTTKHGQTFVRPESCLDRMLSLVLVRPTWWKRSMPVGMVQNIWV